MKTNNFEEKYEDLLDPAALKREKKKRLPMSVRSAFLKKIPKIQQKRYEEKYGKNK